MQENPESQEKKATEGNFFEAPGVPKAESKEDLGARPEGKNEEAISGSTAPLEREKPKKSEFKPEGELETGYTKESWTKPQRGMEEKATVEPGEKREEKAAEEAREKVEEGREEKRTTYTMKKRLTKSKSEHMLFGVCGGLGEYFGIDPTFIRLAFAALALQGIGIVLYIILAIIMPSGEEFKMTPSSGR